MNSYDDCVRTSAPHPTCVSPHGECSIAVYNIITGKRGANRAKRKMFSVLRCISLIDFFSHWDDHIQPASQVLHHLLSHIGLIGAEREGESGPICMKKLPGRKTTQHLSTTNHRSRILITRAAQGTRAEKQTPPSFSLQHCSVFSCLTFSFITTKQPCSLEENQQELRRTKLF